MVNGERAVPGLFWSLQRAMVKSLQPTGTPGAVFDLRFGTEPGLSRHRLRFPVRLPRDFTGFVRLPTVLSGASVTAQRPGGFIVAANGRFIRTFPRRNHSIAREKFGSPAIQTCLFAKMPRFKDCLNFDNFFL